MLLPLPRSLSMRMLWMARRESWRSACRYSPPEVSHSSASRTRFQSASECASAALRAAAKSLVQRRSYTSAPWARAMAMVSSVDPVSSTIILSTQGATLSRQRARLRASFLTIMVRAIVFMRDPPAGMTGDCPGGRMFTVFGTVRLLAAFSVCFMPVCRAGREYRIVWCDSWAWRPQGVVACSVVLIRHGCCPHADPVGGKGTARQIS